MPTVRPGRPTPEQRIAILVDVQNLYYSARHEFPGKPKVCFKRLLDKIATCSVDDGAGGEEEIVDRHVIRAIAYAIVFGETDQSSFHTMLSRSGYEVQAKIAKQRDDGSAKGSWDIQMVLDAIALTSRGIDVICLVTGDGDFVPLVRDLRHKGVRIEIYSFRTSTSEALAKEATAFYPLGSDVLMPEENEEQPREKNSLGGEDIGNGRRRISISDTPRNNE